MRGFGSTEIESGMTCLQLGHVADSPTRSPSVDNRCAAASQSERHRAWRVVPQHAITFVFSNAKSSRQQTHTSSGATVNTLAGDGRVARRRRPRRRRRTRAFPRCRRRLGRRSTAGAAGARAAAANDLRGRSVAAPGRPSCRARSRACTGRRSTTWVTVARARAAAAPSARARAAAARSRRAAQARRGCAPGKRRQLRCRTAPSAYSSARSP